MKEKVAALQSLPSPTFTYSESELMAIAVSVERFKAFLNRKFTVVTVHQAVNPFKRLKSFTNTP